MKILVARIIGNDLTPRHSQGAQFTALRYIVENEEVPASVDRLFVINRIKNKEAEREIIAYLEDRGEKYWQFLQQDAVVCGDGIEINHTRNNIIQYGREQFYHWTFPLDGRCFITDQAYKEMRAQCAAYAERHYAFMPQSRILDYEDVHADLRKNPYAFSEKTPSGAIIRNEYGLGFSIHAKAFFNPELKFGCADKAEMLSVAGLPGPWINMTEAEGAKGSPVRLEVAEEEFQRHHPAQYSGYLLVLPSGNREADASTAARLEARAEALAKFQNS